MPDLAEVELYCAEARDILAHAEDIVHDLCRRGACEGHRMMADQGLAALRNLDRIIERHRRRLAFQALPNAVVQPPPPSPPRKRNWLVFLRRGGGHAGHGVEAHS
ncbi:hypothetical protein ACLBXO_06685 [Methylobacterium sp. C33D]|uniref:hypothetical protein n=1 Tax=Methylobacterium mesophilicum TaxID=39956 RepID=UPI002F2EFB68